MHDHLIIANTTDTLRIAPHDVVAIKADGNYSYIVLADGEERLALIQLGQLAELITQQLGATAAMFIRVGRGVIINQEYIFAINLPKQTLTLRSTTGHMCTLTASHEALRKLKEYVDSYIKKSTTE